MLSKEEQEPTRTDFAILKKNTRITHQAGSRIAMAQVTTDAELESSPYKKQLSREEAQTRAFHAALKVWQEQWGWPEWDRVQVQYLHVTFSVSCEIMEVPF